MSLKTRLIRVESTINPSLGVQSCWIKFPDPADERQGRSEIASGCGPPDVYEFYISRFIPCPLPGGCMFLIYRNNITPIDVPRGPDVEGPPGEEADPFDTETTGILTSAEQQQIRALIQPCLTQRMRQFVEQSRVVLITTHENAGPGIGDEPE